MGSDRAPRPEIEGAIQAARHYDVHVILVGPEETLRAELDRHPGAGRFPSRSSTPAKSSPWTTRPRRPCAPKATPPCAWASTGARRAGRRVCHRRQHRRGHGHREDGAGSTSRGRPSRAGRRLSHRARNRVPSCSTLAPTSIASPHNLEQFAVMGEIYFRSMFGTRAPRVGLLSIGEEESKGNELTREAFQSAEAASDEFRG